MYKKFFSFLIALMIFSLSIVLPYKEVKAFDIPTALWGTMETARAWVTATQIGGGINQNGFSLSQFERSSRDDINRLQVAVMHGYFLFCIYKEKAQLLLNNPSWTDSQINEEAERLGRIDADRFNSNVINVNNTTGTVTMKDFGYWKEFCSVFRSVAKNGINSSSIGDNTEIQGKITVLSGNYVFNNLDNVGANTIEYNGNYYIDSGQYRQWNGSQWVVKNYTADNVPTDRVRIPFIYIDKYTSNIADIYKSFIDVNRLTGNIIANSRFDTTHGLTIRNGEQADIQNNIIAYTNLPVIVNLNNDTFDLNNFDYEDYLSVSSGGSATDFEIAINDALNSTEAGASIKTGAQTETNPYIASNTIPIKRSSVRVGEQEATGVIGWDVPDARTIEGAIAVPQEEENVIQGQGVIAVPESIVTGGIGEGTIAFPKDIPISIPDVADPTIVAPIDDVISEQAGEFYPTQMDLTTFFPFCIPFDIAYCINKFHTPVGSAPVIHIPIVIPSRLQGSLGQSYDVTIDFNDYIVLRNVIRYFILLFFIMGLMKVTRDLIRG